MSKINLCNRPHFSLFQGLYLLKHACLLREEVQQLETEGLQKIESAVSGSEVEGLYGLLRGAVSHSPMSSIPLPPKKHHHAPTATISKLLPQEPKETVPEVSIPVVKEVELASEAPSSAATPALEVAIPTHVAPLHLQDGGIKMVYKCGVEGCSDGPSTSWAAICAHVHRDHLGVRLPCPSCTKTFLNSDALRHHRKSHISQ